MPTTPKRPRKPRSIELLRGFVVSVAEDSSVVIEPYTGWSSPFTTKFYLNMQVVRRLHSWLTSYLAWRDAKGEK